MVAIGEKFSHYKIVSEIGKGGMGEVYLAENTHQLNEKNQSINTTDSKDLTRAQVKTDPVAVTFCLAGWKSA